MGVNCAENNRVNSTKRVFISHASKDNEIISRFIDSILLLGMNLDSSVVAYTSREDTGVMPGESIPEFIQNNIACADVVLLMISEHFKKSEVCLNEMGAALALGKHIVQILLPNVSINTLEWLCSLDRVHVMRHWICRMRIWWLIMILSIWLFHMVPYHIKECNLKCPK